MGKNLRQNLEKVQYISSLLGRKRPVVETEINFDALDIIPTQNIDILFAMTQNETDLEKELYTETTQDQNDTEISIKEIYYSILEDGDFPTLQIKKHLKYLNMALGKLPSMFTGLDASQPWILYWVLNAVHVLQGDVSQETLDGVADRLIKLIHPEGGIGGGAFQLGHAAATYAGLNALALTKSENHWAQIDTSLIYSWLLSLKQPDGSFLMHIGGERDTRAVYCVLSIASMLDILTDELIEGTAEWLGKCQTFEGGFGGVPFDEAHGGYTFCAIAALSILGKEALFKYVKIDKLVNWIATKQLRLEGGFCGRSNKLVDGCYSFWVGGLVGILEPFLTNQFVSRPLLQNYILACCQDDEYGGLRDKPGKRPDFYHTNYVLLGLSITQNTFYIEKETNDIAYSIQSRPIDPELNEVKKSDIVTKINPVFGLPEGVPNLIHDYFKSHKQIS